MRYVDQFMHMRTLLRMDRVNAIRAGSDEYRQLAGPTDSCRVSKIVTAVRHVVWRGEKCNAVGTYRVAARLVRLS